MSQLITWIKSLLKLHLLRKRFPNSVIHFGVAADSQSRLGNYCVLFPNVSLLGASIGSYSYVQSRTVIFNAELGPFCSIAGDVNIGLVSHPTHMVSTSPVFYDNTQPLPKFFTKSQSLTQPFPKTTIGADVWIGQGVMIKAGVKVGVGAVIGAGSIVTKDIPPYCIAAGNPCQPIKQRFPEDICNRLLDSKWWEFNEAELREIAHFFSEPELFLNKLKKSS